MQFRTLVDIPQSPRLLSHRDTILSLGSCFAQDLAIRLRDHKFRVTLNPNGIVYNPAIICTILDRLIEARPWSLDDIDSSDGRFFSYYAHGACAGNSPSEVMNTLNQAFATACAAVQHLDVLMLTFGTAFAYRHIEKGIVVANCHRQPSAQFERILLTPDEIVGVTVPVLEKLKALRPDIFVIVSVSPIRHLRDSAHQNTVSKASLSYALYRLAGQFPNVYYFPAYEILMDELRDYRFYTADMTHPTETAQEYIFNGFIEHAVEPGARTFMTEYTPVLRARNHRVIRRSGKDTAAFVNGMRERLRKLSQSWPAIDLESDRAYFDSLM